MSEQIYENEQSIQKTYIHFILLGMAAHASFIIIFAGLNVWNVAFYNMLSVLFYGGMLYAARHENFRVAVSCIHIEVCVFVIVTVYHIGWGSEIQLYLIAIASLTYFCPYEHTFIPYMFSGLEILVFLMLRLYTGFMAEDSVMLSQTTYIWLGIYNACACFFIILFGAYSSKVSAIVSQQKLKDENRSLLNLANYDQLTGLLSRHAFLKRLHGADGQRLVVALGDIDDFKKVNDTWGHKAGDHVLAETARLMQDYMQNKGNVDICRWGGEEFIMLFHDNSENVMHHVQGLRMEIAQHAFCYHDIEIHITMTFGISMDWGKGSIDDMINVTDHHMYDGKRKGKNCVVFFCEDEENVMPL